MMNKAINILWEVFKFTLVAFVIYSVFAYRPLQEGCDEVRCDDAYEEYYR